MRQTQRWTFAGAVFGALFPVGAAALRFAQYTEDAAIQAIVSDPLFYIICTAPLFLGLFAYFGGRQHQKVLDLNQGLERLVDARTSELEIQRQNVIESAKLASLGTMAASVAHEINNPLGIIHGKARNLLRVLEISPENIKLTREIAEKIMETCERIEKIVSGLKSFSRDGSRDPMVIESADKVVSGALSFCRERLKNNGIELREPPTSEDLQINCRSVLISQVIVNLINNSVDAIRDLNPKWIEVGISRNSNAVELSVTDSGGGIPEHLRQKIMTPFFTTKEAGHGTGIGLSISHGIVAKHGGKFFYDEKSPNTKFIISLPMIESSKVEHPIGARS